MRIAQPIFRGFSWFICIFLFMPGCVRQRDGIKLAKPLLLSLEEHMPFTALSDLKVTNAAEFELRGWSYYLRGTGSPALLDLVESSDDWIPLENAHSFRDAFSKRLPWWTPAEMNPRYIFQGNAADLGFGGHGGQGGAVLLIAGVSSKGEHKEVVVYLQLVLPMKPKNQFVGVTQ